MQADMDLNEIHIFVRVVQVGSFNKAAAQLGMPNSTVSTKVSTLEKRLGITLLHRTTRKLSLTQAGEVFFQSALKHIEGLISAEQEASLSQSEPSGTLRITAPSMFSSSVLPEVIAAYTEKFPKVAVELIASDTSLDLISENIDIAIRAGSLSDSAMKSLKLGVSYFAPFASSSYLKTHEKITHPKDLLNHTCVQFTPLGRNRWEFTSQSKTRVNVAMKQKLILNELYLVRELAVSGQGVALLPTFVCEKDVGQKQLTRILRDWRSEAKDVQFVYPAQKYVSPKLSEFISLAGAMIKKRLISSEF
ncbi:LysR substrate-binding domain-containing protein [Bdellovibrio sp. HCB274]|uniref:LysR family transcriptional regulator n=1 Tax=Bdellovibrio sp. HCB274 TaxID=3394361 RepID=UPI0039B68FEA